MLEVNHRPNQSRYVLSIDGAPAGSFDYSRSGDVLVALHVEVDPAYGGHGHGSELVRRVLDDVRRQGLRVRPVCPFVAYFLAEHPEYADLQSAPPGPGDGTRGTGS